MAFHIDGVTDSGKAGKPRLEQICVRATERRISPTYRRDTTPSGPFDAAARGVLRRFRRRVRARVLAGLRINHPRVRGVDGKLGCDTRGEVSELGLHGAHHALVYVPVSTALLWHAVTTAARAHSLKVRVDQAQQ